MDKPILISIVDDDEPIRKATTRLVTAAGFQAETFGSGEEFLNSGLASSPSCLIVDMQMPGISGLDLYQRLAESGTSLPTIIITAYPDERVRARALRAGVIGYLSKPFSANELIGCIRSTIQDGKAAN
jgi:FixJ family two-component response regulator